VPLSLVIGRFLRVLFLDLACGEKLLTDWAKRLSFFGFTTLAGLVLLRAI
jgi:hypothetical protein